VPRTADELYRAVHASISIPGLSGSPIEMNGRLYTDGSISHPLPVKQLVKRLHPTHILLIPNRISNISSSQPFAERAIYETFLRSRVSPVVRVMARRRRSRLAESLRWLREDSGVPTLVAWSAGTIGQFERNSSKITQAAAVAEQQWLELLH